MRAQLAIDRRHSTNHLETNRDIMKHQTNQTREITRRQAPIRVALSIDIPEPREAVFAYLADLTNNSNWNWAVRATTPLRAGAPHQGAQYIQHRAAPRTGTDLLRISRYSPPGLLEVTGRVDEGVVRYRYELVPTPAGRTRLTTSVELRSSGEALTREDLFAARLGEAVAANLESLRAAIAEARELAPSAA